MKDKENLIPFFDFLNEDEKRRACIKYLSRKIEEIEDYQCATSEESRLWNVSLMNLEKTRDLLVNFPFGDKEDEEYMKEDWNMP
jgi:hypothetical protein